MGCRGAQTILARPGHLVDYWLHDNPTRTIAAPRVLAAVLGAFGIIWPGRECLHDAAHGEVALGDVWRHPQIRCSDLTDQLMPSTSYLNGQPIHC